MSISITVCDETTSGDRTHEFQLDFPTEIVTVSEIIRSRVYQEVKDHNLKKNQMYFQGLVQPTETEKHLNGYRFKQPRQLDWQKQFDTALESFKRNGFIVLIDDQQAEDLDAEIRIQSDTSISFLKLVPLVGG